MLLYLTFKKIVKNSENLNRLARWGHIHGIHPLFHPWFVSYLNLTMELILAESWRWLLIGYHN